MSCTVEIEYAYLNAIFMMKNLVDWIYPGYMLKYLNKFIVNRNINMNLAGDIHKSQWLF